VPGERTCLTCAHTEMDTDGEDVYLECRRYPPKIVEDDCIAFPAVQAHLWCAEWKDRDDD